MPCAPSWASALRTRSGSLAPVATISSAPGDLQRVDRGAVRGAGDHDGQRHLQRAP